MQNYDAALAKEARLSRSLLYAILALVFLALGPALSLEGASFLGQDVSALAAGVVKFYPWVAIFEIVRVLAIALLLLTLVIHTARLAAIRVPQRAWRWVIFPLSPLAAYGLWLFAALIHYPALAESFMSPSLKHLVQKAAQVSSPTAWTLAAALALLAPLLAAFVVSAGRRTKVALFAVCEVAVFVSLYALPGTAVSLVRRDPAAAAAKPNVLVIAIDSLRRDRLGRPEVLPSLGALRDDPRAVSFEDHHIGVPRTFPSWLEILQGRYAPRTGVRHMFPGFAPRQYEFKSFVSAMRDSGYLTMVASDFAGDIFPRFETGFERVLAPKLTLSTMIRLSVDQAFPAFLPVVTAPALQGVFSALKESPAYGDAGHLTQLALKQLHDVADPWLLTVFYSTAHFPYAAPYPYWQLFADPSYEGAFPFQKNPDLAAGTAISAEDIAQVRALFDGALRSIDDQIAALFAKLRASGAWDQTMIVVTADHGEDLFEAGMLQGHGEHLRSDRVLEVPLIVKLPAPLSPAVKRLNHLSRSIDIAPTLLSALGLGRVPTMEGFDHLPWILGERAADPELSAYSETGIWFSREGEGFFQKKRLDYPGISGLLSFDQGYSDEIVLSSIYESVVVTAKHRALVHGPWKLIYMPTHEGLRFELYDRKADPGNSVDLATSHPEVLSEMKERLIKLMVEMESGARLVDGFVVPR